MSALKPKMRNAYLVGTILLVAFLFGYYFLIHIPEKDQDMRNRGIRVMNRMVNNLKEKETHYKNSIENFECQYVLERILEDKEDKWVIDALLYSDCFWMLPAARESSEVFWERVANIPPEYSNEKYLDTRDSIALAMDFKRIAQEATQKLDPQVQSAMLADSSQFLIWVNVVNRDQSGFDIKTKSYGDVPEFLLGVKSEDFSNDIKRFEFFDDIFLVDPITGEVVDRSAKNIRYFNQSNLSATVEEEDATLPADENTQFSGIKIAPKKISNTTYFTYSSVVQINHRKYLLTGLIEKEKYVDQVRSVSIWVVMISVIFLVFLIQILPILKPFLLSKNEQLKGSDVMWSSFSVVFGMAALSLFALAIDTFSIEEIDLVDRKLKKYTRQIEQKFSAETNKALLVLNDYKSGKITNDDSTYQQINGLPGLFHEKKNAIGLLGIDQKGKSYDYLNLFNEGGFKVVNNNNDLDLSYRSYYRIHAKNDSLGVWRIANPADQTKVISYYVASIFSMSSGAHETVVSIKKSKDEILALVYPFQSVNDVYLEPYYTFAIVDKKGQIKYHSDAKKIANENLFDECNRNENVLSFVANNADTSFTFDYALRDYRTHISAIPNTDWHLLTMYEIKNSRLTITSSLAIVFVLILAILVYLFAIHLLLRVQRTRERKYRNRPFIYWFLNPLATAPAVYRELAVVNLGLMVYFLVIYKSFTITLYQSFTLCLATITLAILYNFSVLNEPRIDKENKDLVRTRFLFFEISLLILSSIWLLLYALFLNELEGSWQFLLPPLAMVILIVKEKLMPRGVINRKLSELKAKQYVPFYWHSLTWVLILGVLPALLFFKPVYNMQHIKRATSSLTQEYSHRVSTKNSQDNKINLFAGKHKDSTDLKYVENQTSQGMLELIDPYFEEDGKVFKGQHKAKEQQVTVYEVDDRDQSGYSFLRVELKPSNTYFYQQDVKHNNVVAFSLPRIQKSSTRGMAILFWCFVLISLICLYVLIKKMAEKFFYLELTRTLQTARPKYFIEENPDPETDKEKLTDVKQEAEKQEQKETNIILIGVPSSGRKALALSLFGAKTAKGKSVRFIDFGAGLKDFVAEAKKEDLVNDMIITNFNHSPNDFEHNLEKLNALEFILSARNNGKTTSKLILISSLDIYQIIEIYQERISYLREQKGADYSEKIEMYRNHSNRWEAALYNFTKRTVPLKFLGFGPELNTEHKDENREQQFVFQELNFGSTLTKLIPRAEKYRALLKDEAKTLSEKERHIKLIEAIRDMAENYYFSVWSACSREEKLLLLDLAQDGVLNGENDHALYTLVRKGIIILKPQLAIFNESFKLFILSSISIEETKLIEKLAQRQGNWKTYRYLVIFLVVVIIIFLSLAEEKAVAQITTIVTLGAALFPKIMSMISSLSQRSSFSFSKK